MVIYFNVWTILEVFGYLLDSRNDYAICLSFSWSYCAKLLIGEEM